jgi:hypothetical protein
MCQGRVHQNVHRTFPVIRDPFRFLCSALGIVIVVSRTIRSSALTSAAQARSAASSVSRAWAKTPAVTDDRVRNASLMPSLRRMASLIVCSLTSGTSLFCGFLPTCEANLASSRIEEREDPAREPWMIRELVHRPELTASWTKPRPYVTIYRWQERSNCRRMC